jgi:hypothetical protein
MPDTTGYLIMGLVVVFILLGGYITSLWMRYRNLQQDIQLIEQVREE